MAKVRVTAGTVTDGEWREGRGRFGSYERGGRVFPCGGYVELDDSELTDEQLADRCLRILEVEEELPSEEEEPDPPVTDEAPVTTVETGDPPVLDEVAKGAKKSK